jgi:redox-sensitive bicupin YhaK (pirin superfamily)
LHKLTVRKGHDRGFANHGWLQSYHSFSFAEYYDPQYMHFSVLRVINDDTVAAGMGFGKHPHRDMEIITYVLHGELQHEDNIGNGSVIKAGDVQRMTAGTGIVHSEFNASQSDSVHFLQIWILPERLNLNPGYEDKHFTTAQKLNQWCLIAAKDNNAGMLKGTLKVHQDMQLYATILNTDAKLSYSANENRSLYLHVATGNIEVNSQQFTAGDAVMLNGSVELVITANAESELLLFDLPLHTAQP